MVGLDAAIIMKIVNERMILSNSGDYTVEDESPAPDVYTLVVKLRTAV